MLELREYLRSVLRYNTNVWITFDVYLEGFKGVTADGDPNEVFALMRPPVSEILGLTAVTTSPKRVVRAEPFFPAIQFAKDNHWQVTAIDLNDQTIHFTRGPL